MKLEPADIQSFQKLWLQSFGTEILVEDAESHAVYLLKLLLHVYKPIAVPCVQTSAEQLSILPT